MRVCPVCRNQFPSGSNFCPFDGHRLEALDVDAPSHDRFVGTVLDHRYKIESKLGSGGMGDVYAARHVIIDKPVAVKILRQEYSNDPRQAERFIREARAASRIGHPNIVDVTDFGRLDDGQIYFIMEFLVGVTLGLELKEHGALSTRRSLNLAIQMCNALEAAHCKGIIHRDLKPENIFIVNPLTSEDPDQDTGGRHQDTIKLLDFGIAKITWDEQGQRLTKVGSIFGTPQYMSPEQAAGKDTDHRGDVYSLGCIIYEMLTAEVPFIADTFMGTLTKQMFENPIPPRQLRPDLGIPEPLEQVILKAMSKNPDDRYASMKLLADALDDCFSTSELGPVQRAERVVVVGCGSPKAAVTLKELGDENHGTVHLLMQPRTGPTPSSEGPRPGAAGGSVEVMATPRRTWPLILGGAALFLAMSGVGIYLVLWDDGQRPQPPPLVTTTPAADGATPAPKPAPDAGKRLVMLRISSRPQGATVLANSEPRGQTPHDLQVRAGTSLRLVFRKAGFQEETLNIKPAADAQIEVPLQRRRRVEVPRRPDAALPLDRPRKEDLITPPAFKKLKR